MVKKNRKTTGRFGTRYGASLKEKVAQLEKKAKAKYECPRCFKEKVERVSSGIWHCKKCGVKFAGRAYEFK